MLTRSAAMSLPATLDDARATVSTRSQLAARGISADSVAAQLRARRWQRFGRALLLHNALPTPAERRRLVLLNAGPRAMVAAFTAAEELGLQGWERDVVHVLVPGGTHVRRLPGIPTRVHYAGDWRRVQQFGRRLVQRPAPALVLAAGTFPSPRPAVGLLAAGVQQRLVTATHLREAVAAAPRARHRRSLVLGIEDIAQGAHALSEIDVTRLCRKHGLPEPKHQGVRIEPSGRRRYLDAEWATRSGRRLVVEIDGALHLVPARWWDDQLRQNEIVLLDHMVLRFPSVIVRLEELLVVDQLGRALLV